MKYLIVIFILFFSCTSQPEPQRSFEDYLGKEKTESLNAAIKAWDDFIEENRGAKSATDFTFNFLQTLLVSWDSLPAYQVDCREFETVINNIRKSDLEKEFWIYSNETYDDAEVTGYYVEIQNNHSRPQLETADFTYDFQETIEVPEQDGEPIKHNNPDIQRISSPKSRIIAGIHKYSNDDFIREAAQGPILVGHLSSYIIISGILENKDKVDLSNYFTKALIVQDIFYDFIYTNTCEKRK